MHMTKLKKKKKWQWTWKSESETLIAMTMQMVVVEDYAYDSGFLWPTAPPLYSSESQGESLNWNCSQHDDYDDEVNIYNTATLAL